MENRFYLADRVEETHCTLVVENESFQEICERVREIFDRAWRSENINMEAALRIQKRAIIGYEDEVRYFMEKIKEIIKELGYSDMSYPYWYDSIESAVYHELWGYSGLAPWFSKRYSGSSSAKIIGDRVYFLTDGKMQLQPQRIEKKRREQMIRAFLLGSPKERHDKSVHEIYLLDGTRVTIFRGSMTKNDQDVMVFRRYVVPVFRFEEQAAMGTIPKEAIPLFENMVKLGYNITISGAVRTSKTSFLSTWQSYEDSSLEGVMIETDPEIRMHELMPNAPVMQLIADGDDLKSIVKNLLRSDADYFIIAEARDGIALDTAVKIASKGNRRLKMTFHERSPCDFCHDVAAEIVKSMGGSMEISARAAAKSFDYIFHFIQLKDKGKKRLKSIYEISYDDERGIIYQPICEYDVINDSWTWYWHISPDKEKAGIEEDIEAYCNFSKLLRELGGDNHGEAVIRKL